MKEYNENDLIIIIFEDESYSAQPIPYKIISKTADCYICEFV